ncbi:hypothetical protein V6N13_040841 [Hibiscus sabdariffa]|uniref:Uncharacterized protein n=1 Tax=Hibiscus sabdariffa TaxID=183260 RepID=A0ABR2R9K6_9ROSI
MVRVEEIGFLDQTSQPYAGSSKVKLKSKNLNQDDDSVSITSTDSSTKPSPARDDSQQEVEEDAINAILLGKDYNVYSGMENNPGLNLGEEDLLGKGLKTPPLHGEKGR